MVRMVRWSIASIGALCLACGGTSPLTAPSTLSTATKAAIPGTGDSAFSPDAGLPLLAPETFVGAGDIAQCTNGGIPDATARLLDRNGNALAVPAQVSERPDPSSAFTWIVVDELLAPFAPGDYAVEVTQGRGTQITGFRVTP